VFRGVHPGFRELWSSDGQVGSNGRVADHAGVADEDNPNSRFCWYISEARAAPGGNNSAECRAHWTQGEAKENTRLFHPSNELAATCVLIVDYESEPVPCDLIERQLDWLRVEFGVIEKGQLA
jgi:hypothetical protein